MGSWETWDAHKPEWFTPGVIASIPDEFIPPRFLKKMGGARERRGSAAGSFREVIHRTGAVAVDAVALDGQQQQQQVTE